MNPVISELVNNQVGKECPKCGEDMLTLPSMRLIREGSIYGYNTYYNSCLMCKHTTELVKVHQQFEKELNQRKRERDTDNIVDITPVYGQSILKRILKWVTIKE